MMGRCRRHSINEDFECHMMENQRLKHQSKISFPVCGVFVFFVFVVLSEKSVSRSFVKATALKHRSSLTDAIKLLDANHVPLSKVGPAAEDFVENTYSVGNSFHKVRGSNELLGSDKVHESKPTRFYNGALSSSTVFSEPKSLPKRKILQTSTLDYGIDPDTVRYAAKTVDSNNPNVQQASHYPQKNAIQRQVTLAPYHIQAANVATRSKEALAGASNMSPRLGASIYNYQQQPLQLQDVQTNQQSMGQPKRRLQQVQPVQQVQMQRPNLQGQGQSRGQLGMQAQAQAQKQTQSQTRTEEDAKILFSGRDPRNTVRRDGIRVGNGQSTTLFVTKDKATGIDNIIQNNKGNNKNMFRSVSTNVNEPKEPQSKTKEPIEEDGYEVEEGSIIDDDNSNNQTNRNNNKGPIDKKETKLTKQTKKLVKWLRNRLRKRLSEVATLENEMETETILLGKINQTLSGTYKERQREIKLKLDSQRKLKQFEKDEHDPDVELNTIEIEKRRLSEQLNRVTRTYETLAQIDKDLRHKLHTAGLSHWLHARGKEYMPETAVGVLARSAQILQPVTTGIERAAFEFNSRLLQAAGVVIRINSSDMSLNSKYNNLNDQNYSNGYGTNSPYSSRQANSNGNSWNLFWKVFIDFLMLLPLVPILIIFCRVRKILIDSLSVTHVALYISGIMVIEMFIFVLISVVIGREVVQACQEAAFAAASAHISEEEDLEMEFTATTTGSSALMMGIGGAMDLTVSFLTLVTGLFLCALMWSQVIIFAISLLRSFKATNASGKIYHNHNHYQYRSYRDVGTIMGLSIGLGNTSGKTTVQAELVQMGLLILVDVHFWKHAFTPVITGTTVVSTSIAAHIAYAGVFAGIFQRKRMLLGWDCSLDKRILFFSSAVSTWTTETIDAMCNVFNDGNSSSKVVSGYDLVTGNTNDEDGKSNGSDRRSRRKIDDSEYNREHNQDHEDTRSFMSSSSLPSRTIFSSSSSSSSSVSLTPSVAPSSMTVSTSMVSPFNNDGNRRRASNTAANHFTTGVAIGANTGSTLNAVNTHRQMQALTQNLFNARSGIIDEDQRSGIDEGIDPVATATRYPRWNGQNSWPARQSSVDELPWNGPEAQGRVAFARSRRLIRRSQLIG